LPVSAICSNVRAVFSTSHTAVDLGIKGLRSLIRVLLLPPPAPRGPISCNQSEWEFPAYIGRPRPVQRPRLGADRCVLRLRRHSFALNWRPHHSLLQCTHALD